MVAIGLGFRAVKGGGAVVGVAANDDDNAAGHAVNLSGVILEEPVVAAGAEVVEVLVLIQRFGSEHD